MLALSAIGRGGIVWIALAALFAWAERRPRILITVAIAAALASLVTDAVVKPVVGRERPFAHEDAIAIIGDRPHDASFPSGHAANAFAGASCLSGLVPQARVVWWTLSVAIAYSRVYVGVHYPSDVIAGALLGVACAVVARAIIAAARR